MLLSYRFFFSFGGGPFGRGATGRFWNPGRWKPGAGRGPD